MIIYKFIIDRDISFLYWLQSLADWRSSFDPKEASYYRRSVGQINGEGREIVKEFGSLLNESGVGAAWLWRYFVGKAQVGTREQKLLAQAERVLGPKFEDFWKEAYPRLKKWQKKLIDSPAKTNIFFEQVNSHLGTGFGGEVQVVLNISASADQAEAHFSPEYGHSLLLNISRVKYKHLAEVYRELVRGTVEAIKLLVPEKAKIEEKYLNDLLVRYFDGEGK